jgi:hypothetical protein
MAFCSFQGGDGGPGGRGGHGGGGGGGPSVGVFRVGAAQPVVDVRSFVIGGGGAGGASDARPGMAGLRAEVFPR